MNKKVAVSAVLAAGALLIGAGILLTAEPEVVPTLAPVDMTTDDTPQQDLGPPGSEAPSVGTLPENSSSLGNSSSFGNSSPPGESAGAQGEDVNSSEDLEQDDTKTPEDIDQALKDKETEIDQQIEDGTYTPPTPNPEPTDPVEPVEFLKLVGFLKLVEFLKLVGFLKLFGNFNCKSMSNNKLNSRPR